MKDDVAAARPKPPLWRRLAVGPGAAALVVVDVATLGFITLGFEMVASRILTPLFVSGIIVCFPPLMVLGMYSPLSVRLVLKDPHDAGRVSGGLFAISSAGNIAGTIVTTFLLIPNVGTRAITLAFAAFLVISGVISVAIAATRPRD